MSAHRLVSVRTKINWKNPLHWAFFLIRKVQGTFNHTSLFEINDNDVTVIEAQPKGVAYLSHYMFKHWGFEKEIAVWRPNFNYDEEVMRQFLIDQIGKKYDFRSLWHMFWFYVRRFWRYIGKRSEDGAKYGGKTGQEAKEKWYCSELATGAFNHVNPVCFPDWHKLAPNEAHHDAGVLFTLEYYGPAQEYEPAA